MTRPDTARRRFAAALFLYLAWVAALATMAVTSSRRPPVALYPPAADAPTDPSDPE
jgi:hypothetical protein